MYVIRRKLGERILLHDSAGKELAEIIVSSFVDGDVKLAIGADKDIKITKAAPRHDDAKETT